jgi:hypothetical protein
LPHTISGYVNVAKVTFNAMTRDVELARNPADGLEAIDTWEHPVYGEKRKQNKRHFVASKGRGRDSPGRRSARKLRRAMRCD